MCEAENQDDVSAAGSVLYLLDDHQSCWTMQTFFIFSLKTSVLWTDEKNEFILLLTKIHQPATQLELIGAQRMEVLIQTQKTPRTNVSVSHGAMKGGG